MIHSICDPFASPKRRSISESSHGGTKSGPTGRSCPRIFPSSSTPSRSARPVGNVSRTPCRLPSNDGRVSWAWARRQFHTWRARSGHMTVRCARQPERSDLMTHDIPSESNRVRCLFRERFTFQISVDTPHVQQGLALAEAALKAGVTILELGTPLLKYGGVRKVVT